MTPEDRGLTTPIVDDAFTVLSDWRRRAVCYHLSTSDDAAVEVRALATAVARRGAESDLPESETTVEAVETALTETHLPFLHDLGILDFDERSGAVKYWGSPTVEKWATHATAVTERDEF